MFLKKKNGSTITLEQLIVIIICVIAIIFLTGFGSDIYKTIFPSGDKSSRQSFELLYKSIDEKAKSTKNYESTFTTLYMKEDYRILMFKDNIFECDTEYHWYGPTQRVFYAPDDCKNAAQCICLYDDDPSGGEKDKNDNVIRCYTFDTAMNLDTTRMDLNLLACGKGDKKPYTSYIIVRRVEPSNNMPYVYILDDNTYNKALEDSWNVKLCSDKSTSDICKGAVADSIYEAKNDAELQKIMDRCQPGFKSMKIRCMYQSDGSCATDCSVGSITNEMCTNTFKTCAGYNDLGNEVKYMIPPQNSKPFTKSYTLCTRSNDFCPNIGECTILDKIQVYACKNTNDGSVDANTPGCEEPPEKCKAQYAYETARELPYIKAKIGLMITAYDDKDKDCEKYMGDNFYPINSVMVCKEGLNKDCQNFVDNNYDSCQITYFQDGDKYWITHYDKDNGDCEKITDYFTEAQFCTKKTN